MQLINRQYMWFRNWVILSVTPTQYMSLLHSLSTYSQFKWPSPFLLGEGQLRFFNFKIGVDPIH